VSLMPHRSLKDGRIQGFPHFTLVTDSEEAARLQSQGKYREHSIYFQT